MTEAEWLASDDPGELANYANEIKRPAQKFRHLSCGFCRRIWHLLTFPGSRELVEMIEQFTDEDVEPEMLVLARSQYTAALTDSTQDRRSAEGYAAEAVAAAALRKWQLDSGNANTEIPWLVSDFALTAVKRAESPGDDELASAIESRECRAMCVLLRDIFGNPFRIATFDPAWRTDTSTALARQVYETRDFSAMPILADALQDAGCDSAAVLEHCRGEGPHVRGCWVVNIVLGKE